MDEDRTLLKFLAGKMVVKSIRDGKYVHINKMVNYTVGDYLLSQIQHMLVLHSKPVFIRLIGEKFLFSEVNLKELNMTKEWIEMIGTKTLSTLILGNMVGIPATFCGGEKGERIQIIPLLESILNMKSQAKLNRLGIEGHEQFEDGYIARIGEMLPKLEHFVISGRRLLEGEFSNLCNYFSQLYSLDISDTQITSIKGISNLTSLRVLAIRNIEFESTNDLIELGSLKTLEALDLARTRGFIQPTSSKIIEQYLESGIVLPRLQILDCSGTKMNEDSLHQILATHPELIKVYALRTQLNILITGTTEIFHNNNTESMMTALEHYIAQQREFAVRWILEDLKRGLLQNRIMLTNVYTKLICDAVRALPKQKYVHYKAVSCLAVFFSRYRDEDEDHFEQYEWDHLIDTLGICFEQWGSIMDAMDHQLRLNIWRIFQGIGVWHRASTEEMDRIGLMAVDYISYVDDIYAVSRALLVFAYLIERMSPPVVEEVCRNRLRPLRLEILLKTFLDPVVRQIHYWIYMEHRTINFIMKRMTKWSRNACNYFVENGVIDTLICYLHRLQPRNSDIKEVLVTMFHIAVLAPADALNDIYTVSNNGILELLFNYNILEVRYLIVWIYATILSRVPKPEEEPPTWEKMRKTVNEGFTEIPGRHLVNYCIFVPNDILADFIEDPTWTWPVIWALLTVRTKICLEMRVSDLIPTIANIESNNGTISSLRFEILELYNQM